jgi:hypothetical protein
MTRRITEAIPVGRDGYKVVTYRATKARRKSEARLIPWTAGPQTTGQKIARALWG